MPDMTYTLEIDVENYKSIIKAQQAFGKLSSKIDEALNNALFETGEKMERKAHSILASYGIDDGELASSIVLDKTNDGINLTATSNHADYVEFGTGIRGSESPHPKPDGWEYDVNGYGWTGWFYYDNQHKLRWTAGSPSKPFMYKSWLYGSQIVGSQVTKHMNKLLRSVEK